MSNREEEGTRFLRYQEREKQFSQYILRPYYMLSTVLGVRASKTQILLSWVVWAFV